jgi:hypothetical protein
MNERLSSGYFPGVLSIISRRFGTLCQFHLQQVMKCEWGQAGNCPYLYGKRVVGERWSGPIRGEGRGRSSGSQEGAWSWWVGEVYKSYVPLESLTWNCCFCPLRRCIRGFHALLSISSPRRGNTQKATFHYNNTAKAWILVHVLYIRKY